MTKISIIVPVYNAQNWIAECIESLIVQTEEGIEIILVDDKSKDDSLQICENYANRDNRIRVIKKENGGPHSARKAGTKAATSKYVMYVDADDWIEKDMVKRMLEKIEKTRSQCLICGYTEHMDDQIVTVQNKIESGVYRDERLKEMVLGKMLCADAGFEQKIAPALWGKLFIREVMQGIMDEVDEDLWIGEDLACTMKYLMRCRTVEIANDESGYHYVIRKGTITTKYDPYYFDKAQRLVELLVDDARKLQFIELQNNINYYKLYLLYREIGVALEIQDKRNLKKCLCDICRAAASPMYKEIRDEINWKKLKVTLVEKHLLRSLMYGRHRCFERIFFLMYRKRRYRAKWV